MKKVKITLLWRRESLTEVGGNKEFSLVFRRSQTLWVGYRSLAYIAVLQIFGPSDLVSSGLFEEEAFLVYPICFYEIVCDKWCLHESVRQLENGLKSGFVKHWLNSV